MITVLEWSNAFDVLVADYIRVNLFGFLSPLSFDEYEKSLFLTKAQEEIVKEIYTGDIPPTSFEKTEATRRLLDSLVKTNIFEDSLAIGLLDKLVHSTYLLPDDCWYIIYEQVKVDSTDKCTNGKVLRVQPITHDNYQRTINNPFRGPNSRKVLRLDTGHLQVELVSTFNIDTYTIRYLSKPAPIVLLDFTDEGVSIEGEVSPQVCLLPDLIHQDILNRAVLLAVSTRVQLNKSN